MSKEEKKSYTNTVLPQLVPPKQAAMGLENTVG